MKIIEHKLKKTASPGEVYPFLSLLKKHGFVKSERPGQREKKVYHLTKKGRVFVKKMLNRFGSLIEIAIEPQLTVCAHCGCEVYKGGYGETIGKKKMMFCCQHCARSFKESSL